MYRLLIVDNEEYVVDGLVELFNQDHHLDLDVIGVYSSAEALTVLMTTAIDVVLTDIRMPGMNGLELQKVIQSRWPYCKVIFLSGYDDFNYVQEAMRNGSDNYILKTEDDEVIIDAVRQSILDIEEQRKAQLVLSEAKDQLKQAMIALQKELIESLLIGDSYAHKTLEKQFDELQFPLSHHKPVLVVIGKVDEWASHYSVYDRSIMLYAVQNIANEYLSLSFDYFSFIYEQSKLIWLIQSKVEPWMERAVTASDKNFTSHVIYGTFECIQSSCKELLQLPMSFAIGAEPVVWDTLNKEFDQLIDSIQMTVKKQMLVIDYGRHPEDQMKRIYVMQNEMFKHYDRFVYALEHKHREEFERILKLLIDCGEEAISWGNTLVALQITSTVLSILFRCIDRLSRDEIPEEIKVIKQSCELGKFPHWETQKEQLGTVADYVFQLQDYAEEDEEHRIVEVIHHYVQTHLGGDLSLKTMALALGHNPSYLSRLYKQKAGRGLSETIAEMRLEKSKQLLAESQYRIQDISKTVGFLSDHYFYRFFKRAMKITPHEYREQLLKERNEN